MDRRLRLAVVFLAVLATACDRRPTAPSDQRPDAAIRDGTDVDGNPDFFFLPPLVPSPVGHPHFEAGDFNADVASSVTVRVCQLGANDLTAQGFPTAQTTCDPTVPTFSPGAVTLVKDPVTEGGWWRAFNPPTDGFYYVRWDTRQSNLILSKYYRIHVLLAGVELGIADIDPMNGLREARNVATNDVIPVIDNTWLPIMFRIEHGALCENPVGCVEKTITNDNPTGTYQVIAATDASGQTIAGGIFPDGWLPTGTNPDGTPRPTSVVVRVERVETGTPVNGVFPNPCHVGTEDEPFTHQQFNGCFNFSTFPTLQPIDPDDPLEPTRTFAVDVTGVVCIEMDREDPRFHFLQLWASDRHKTPVEAPHRLTSSPIPDDFLGNNDCDGVYSSLYPGGRFALVSDALRKVAAGFGRVFGVKEARAVDLGLGGLMPEFSNVSPVLSAELRRVSPAEQTLDEEESAVEITARVFGTHIHDGRPLAEGLPGMPVTFSLAPGSGTIERTGDVGGEEEDTPTRLVVISSPEPFDEGDPPAGYASVSWTPPGEAGTYTLVATSQAAGEFGGNGVAFTVTVPECSGITGSLACTIDNFGVAFNGNTAISHVTHSGLLSDELINTETFRGRIEIDQRAQLFDDGTRSAQFYRAQQARAVADRASRTYARLAPEAAGHAEVLNLGALSHILFAEIYCGAVPMSEQLADGSFAYGPVLSTTELLEIAIRKADSALAISASAAGNGTTDAKTAQAHLARIVKARALLNLNRSAEAATAIGGATGVPTTYQYINRHSESTGRQSNGTWATTVFVARFGVADAEGTNGLPFRTEGDTAGTVDDPRVVSRRRTANNGRGFDGVTPHWIQQKYPFGASPIVIADGVEARLIEAEAALRAGNPTSALQILNDLRSNAALLTLRGYGAASLPPLVLQTTAAAQQHQLFSERAYWLYLTAHRLGDLRRLIQQYERGDESVFPTGDYHKAGAYGTDVNSPVPQGEDNNPNFERSACVLTQA